MLGIFLEQEIRDIWVFLWSFRRVGLGQGLEIVIEVNKIKGVVF